MVVVEFRPPEPASPAGWTDPAESTVGLVGAASGADASVVGFCSQPAAARAKTKRQTIGQTNRDMAKFRSEIFEVGWNKLYAVPAFVSQ
jgi:hypothetical protein